MHTNRAGFTLLEAVVGLAIVSMCGVSALSLARTRVSADAKLNDVRVSAELARQVLDSVLIMHATTATAEEHDFAPPFAEYRWSLKTYSTDDGSVYAAVTVTGPVGGAELAARITQATP